MMRVGAASFNLNKHALFAGLGTQQRAGYAFGDGFSGLGLGFLMAYGYHVLAIYLRHNSLRRVTVWVSRKRRLMG